VLYDRSFVVFHLIYPFDNPTTRDLSADSLLFRFALLRVIAPHIGSVAQNSYCRTETAFGFCNWGIYLPMATAIRRRGQESFEIHEDAPTEDTEMGDDVGQRTEDVGDDQDEEDDDDNVSESSDDGELVETSVQLDMEKLQDSFPGFRDKYRLIKRIGEGKNIAMA
jgi:hypothetical protein